MRFDVAGIALAFCLITVPALADDTIKIGYIDPLSGGGASIGAIGLKTYQYLATASPHTDPLRMWAKKLIEKNPSSSSP